MTALLGVHSRPGKRYHLLSELLSLEGESNTTVF